MTRNGIHSQVFLCSNLARTSEFLTTALGLRLVKRTVSPHSERLLQSYFGFGSGAGLDGDPFAVVGYLEWDPIFYGVPGGGLIEPATVDRAVNEPVIGDARGRWGIGTTHHLALH